MKVSYSNTRARDFFFFFFTLAVSCFLFLYSLMIYQQLILAYDLLQQIRPQSWLRNNRPAERWYCFCCCCCASWEAGKIHHYTVVIDWEKWVIRRVPLSAEHSRKLYKSQEACQRAKNRVKWGIFQASFLTVTLITTHQSHDNFGLWQELKGLQT